MKVYLCGPINGCTDEECKDWRDAAKKIFPQAIDPMRRDYRGREDECVNEIVEGDLADIGESELILVNAPGPSWGTAMEMRDSFLRDTPTVVVVPPGQQRISPWLRYHSTKLVTSFDEAYWQIKNWQ